MRVGIPSFGNNFALEASQVIYAGGAVSSRIEMAQMGKQMAELDWRKNRQDIHFLLLGWYLDLYKTRNQIRVLDRNLELADHVIDNMRARDDRGACAGQEFQLLVCRNRSEIRPLFPFQKREENQEGYVNFMTSFTDLRTREKSVELADENYAVISNRYENGLALLTEMLDAGSMKLSADLALENARINVVYNYYKMKYLTNTLE